MNKIPLLITLLLTISSALTYANDEEKALRKEKTQLELEIAKHEATGLGDKHPALIKRKEKLEKIHDQILEIEQNFKEVIVFLEGTKSQYMQGHHKYGTTNQAIQELLFSGWRIRQTIPAGEKAAYVWLYSK